MKLSKLFFATSILFSTILFSQQKTYCNPINIDYGYTPIPNFSKDAKHRATADPVIVNFKGNYFLFSTNQSGYWWSDDMLNWNFISRKFLKPENEKFRNIFPYEKIYDNSDNKNYDELCAPAVFVMNEELYVIGSTHAPFFAIWKSKNPTKDDWQIAVDNFKVGAWDPGFLYDEDLKKLFLYWGSSNDFPIMGTEIDTTTLQSTGFTKPLLKLNPELHGWERFGENNQDVFLKPFIEGAWMTKHNGKYYLQYGAPGTEFSGYADGVYVSENPLHDFKYQKENPFSYKVGGFARGAGHGSTFQDNFGNWWHVSTVAIGVKNNFERRIGIWPSGFDKDDALYCNTVFGDYPTFLPEFSKNSDHQKGLFTGWMLLNYNKPVQVSSTLGGYQPNFAVDEDIKTYWSAKTGNSGEWLQTDLGEISTINAIQINYADQDATFSGKISGISHQYKIYASKDGKSWKIIIDKSKNTKDVPHDYVELTNPEKARFLKIKNLKMPSGKFALSGFRVFGKGSGNAPEKVRDFIALRTNPKEVGERRTIWIKWKQNDNADGYNIYFGKSPEKLYGNIMVYGKNEYYFGGADATDAYYFQIEAFNNNGISEKSEVIKAE